MFLNSAVFPLFGGTALLFAAKIRMQGGGFCSPSETATEAARFCKKYRRKTVDKIGCLVYTVITRQTQYNILCLYTNSFRDWWIGRKLQGSEKIAYADHLGSSY